MRKQASIKVKATHFALIELARGLVSCAQLSCLVLSLPLLYGKHYLVFSAHLSLFFSQTITNPSPNINTYKARFPEFDLTRKLGKVEGQLFALSVVQSLVCCLVTEVNRCLVKTINKNKKKNQ